MFHKNINLSQLIINNMEQQAKRSGRKKNMDEKHSQLSYYHIRTHVIRQMMVERKYGNRLRRNI